MSIYTGALERAAAGASAASAALFASLSSIRGKRFFHPVGAAYGATATFTHCELDLPFEGTATAKVRLSRGAGVPGSLPDVYGLAIKLSDLGHDFLLATSGSDALSRHLLVPAPGFFSLSYSSVLPYEMNGRLIVFGARADASLKSANTARPEELDALVATRKLRFDLTASPVGSSKRSLFGSIVIHSSLTEDLHFNPWNCLAPLRPAGPLNRLRRETYEASQQARPTP